MNSIEPITLSKNRSKYAEIKSKTEKNAQKKTRKKCVVKKAATLATKKQLQIFYYDMRVCVFVFYYIHVCYDVKQSVLANYQNSKWHITE